jgi:mannosyltransferase
MTLARVPRWVLGALLLACIVRLWIMALPSSLWVDEMVTRFVVELGGAHPSLQVAPQVPQSLYYWLPRWSATLLGTSEVSYRLPSVLLMAAALYFIARLAGRLIHPQAQWFAVFACLSLRGFNYQASDARPYALATLVAAAGSWALTRWLDDGRWRDAAAFALCGALLWRVHLIDWPFYLVWGAYALVVLWRGQTRVSWAAVVGVFALVGVALIPVALASLKLAREAGAHVIVDPPRLSDLESALKPGLVVSALAIAALLARWRHWVVPELKVPAPALALVLGWWVIHPACLYGYSILSGNSVFVERYLSISLVGAALTSVLMVALFLPPELWRGAAAALGLGVLLAFGQWNSVWPRHHNSNWRAAVASVNRLADRPDTLVLCPSPFIEARSPVWRPDYPLPGFLYAHLRVYPMRGQPYLLPYRSSPEAEAFAGELAHSKLASGDRFLILGGDRNVRFWRDWLRRAPELAGWQARELGPFGDVLVAVFEKLPEKP